MKLHKVSDKVCANWDGATGGNVGIITLDENALVVDAQYPGSARKFREAIPKITEKPLSHLLLTHVHGDHVFGNMVFKDLEIVSHKRLWEKMETSLRNEWAPGNLEKMLDTYKRDAPERWWLFDGLEIVLPTTTFTDKWEIDCVEFIHTGGHSDCSSIVYIPDDKLLFAGDLLFVNRFPWAGDPTANPDSWIEAFQKILKMDIETIIPGHGPLCNEEEVEKQLLWMKEIRWIMKALIKDGLSEEEVVSHPYRELYPTDRPEWQKRSYARWYKVWKK
jgi:glyoxylase-like metal-dependent hydrolase (beta-lactamase superfamily II)